MAIDAWGPTMPNAKGKMHWKLLSRRWRTARRPDAGWSCSCKARRLGAAWREKLETLLLLPPLEDEEDVDDRSVSGASCLVGATCCSRSSQELAAHCQ
jgi:hypothetical protein